MRTLVSALDWGLGHTTRIIPVIKQLIENGEDVIIGASKKQEHIYKEFFPKQEIILLPSVGPIYSHRSNQLFSLMVFIPRFILSIVREHKTLKKLIIKHSLNKVVSDNRYGLFNKAIRSIIITHQLTIEVPDSIRYLKRVVNKLNCRVLSNFDECWVPDFEGDKSLSGNLSKPQFPISGKIAYIGNLSRFSIVQAVKVNKIPELLFLISGPEKQRTVFENLIVETLKKTGRIEDYLIVRGLPGNTKNTLPNSVNHCTSNKLKTLILNARYIVCRAGYSTIMDLAVLGRYAILIPTPGQPEQEYLAEYLSQKGSFQKINQSELATCKLDRMVE